MLNDFCIETPNGELCLSDISEDQWNDIVYLSNHIRKTDKIDKTYKAFIAAFFVWMTEREILIQPKTDDDNLH